MGFWACGIGVKGCRSGVRMLTECRWPFIAQFGMVCWIACGWGILAVEGAGSVGALHENVGCAAALGSFHKNGASI